MLVPPHGHWDRSIGDHKGTLGKNPAHSGGLVLKPSDTERKIGLSVASEEIMHIKSLFGLRLEVEM